MDASGRDIGRLVPAGVGGADRGAWALRGFSLDRAFPAVAVLPTFVVMLCIFGIPLLFSLYLSFTGWALDQTKNDYLTGKAPFKFESCSLQRRVWQTLT